MSGTVHLIGIGGTGMGTLAGLLKRAGWTVTGSDLDIYPPMSERLAAWGITPAKGYRADNLAHQPDVVVIGNVIRVDNPEAQAAQAGGFRIASMPSLLRDEFLSRRRNIVVAGTHGKSTTTALIAQALHAAGQDPGFLVGAAMLGWEDNFALGAGPHFVIEGDEYDTAYFDKVPKFVHYLPRVALITSLEFDHADIYIDIADVERAFGMLVERVPPEGALLIWEGATRALALAGRCRGRVLTYGQGTGAHYRLLEARSGPAGLELAVSVPERRESLRLRVPLWGDHNALNALAALGALHLAELDAPAAAEALGRFSGLRRRMELVAEVGGVAVVDDFAHHPTAIRETVKGLRQRFAGRRLVVAFEPRSATSCRAVMQDDLGYALGAAEVVLLTRPFRMKNIPPADRIDVARVARLAGEQGAQVELLDDPEAVVAAAAAVLRPGDVFCAMSNGHFGDVPRRIAAALAAR